MDEFFLEAVEQQALANTRRVKGILELYDEMKIAVSEITRSQHSPAILDAILTGRFFGRPISLIVPRFPNQQRQRPSGS